MASDRPSPVPPSWQTAAADAIEVQALLGTFDPADDADPVHHLVRRFRAGDPEAVARVLAAATEATAARPRLHGVSCAGVVVPGHDGGFGESLVRLVRHLGATHGWSASRTHVLERDASIEAAKLKRARDPEGEAAGIRLRRDAVPASVRTVVLIDDVLASGGTLRACVSALRREGWDGAIVAVVVAAVRQP